MLCSVKSLLEIRPLIFPDGCQEILRDPVQHQGHVDGRILQRLGQSEGVDIRPSIAQKTVSIADLMPCEIKSGSAI